MPLPFLLIGAAVVAGAYGVKKGLDAKQGKITKNVLTSTSFVI